MKPGSEEWFRAEAMSMAEGTNMSWVFLESALRRVWNEAWKWYDGPHCMGGELTDDQIREIVEREFDCAYSENIQIITYITRAVRACLALSSQNVQQAEAVHAETIRQANIEMDKHAGQAAEIRRLRAALGKAVECRREYWRARGRERNG